MEELTEQGIEFKVAVESTRLEFHSPEGGLELSPEERETLENFWNPYLHKRRDYVPLCAILDREIQKLTSRADSKAAGVLVRVRLRALMKAGLVGDEVLEWSNGKVPSTAQLWLTNDGAAYFASGFPAALRSPMLFARRHLSLLQILGVAVSVSLAIGTFVGRALGWLS